MRILKRRILKGNVGRIKGRDKRELLIKIFYNWRFEKTRRILSKIVNCLKIISHIIKNKLCKKPFDKVKQSKIIKEHQFFYQKEREKNKNNNKDMLRNILNKWRNKGTKINIKDLKLNFVSKLKKDIKKSKSKILMKYLTRWKLYNKILLDYKFSKGLNLIDNYA